MKTESISFMVNAFLDELNILATFYKSNSAIVCCDFCRRPAGYHETNPDFHHSILQHIWKKICERKQRRFAQGPLCATRYVLSWKRALFSFIAVTQYDVRALRARPGKEYKVIDGIINSTATESRDVRWTDRYRLQTDKSPSRQRGLLSISIIR